LAFSGRRCGCLPRDPCRRRCCTAETTKGGPRHNGASAMRAVAPLMFCSRSARRSFFSAAPCTFCSTRGRFVRRASRVAAQYVPFVNKGSLARVRPQNRGPLVGQDSLLSRVPLSIANARMPLGTPQLHRWLAVSPRATSYILLVYRVGANTTTLPNRIQQRPRWWKLSIADNPGHTEDRST
jgi:hypothetical protein